MFPPVVRVLLCNCCGWYWLGFTWWRYLLKGEHFTLFVQRGQFAQHTTCSTLVHSCFAVSKNCEVVLTSDSCVPEVSVSCNVAMQVQCSNAFAAFLQCNNAGEQPVLSFRGHRYGCDPVGIQSTWTSHSY